MPFSAIGDTPGRWPVRRQRVDRACPRCQGMLAPDYGDIACMVCGWRYLEAARR